MKRLLHYELYKWQKDSQRKPLIIRGVRQTGKTHAVRYLGESFDDYVEVNLERDAGARALFEGNLGGKQLLRNLGLYLHKPIQPGRTLLFLDEIQAAPNAITALRYFYEEVPELHLIAAGSLLDFAIEQVGIPVGRVTSLYLYPLSFAEFLVAMGAKLLVGEILNHPIDKPIPQPLHQKLLDFLGEYLAIGGMPEVVKCWRDSGDPQKCLAIHHTLLDAYQQDFQKYAKRYQLKYLNLLLQQLPRFIGKQLKYARLGKECRKRDLEPCLDLLVTAGVAHRITHTSGNGIPIGAEASYDLFKPLFLDIGLTQALLGLNLADFFLKPEQAMINRGEIAEAFVGQELLAYSPSYKKGSLYYWQGKGRSQAEIDYLHQTGEHIIPIEVKSGKGTTLKSLHHFLETHSQTPYGIRLSTQNYSLYNQVHSYPLYAVMQIAKWDAQEAWKALIS